MAQYYGYRTVPHNSFNQWYNATIGNGYNVDYSYGNQCWDYCALLWYQYNLRLITKAGGGGAIDCWTSSRYINAKSPFKSYTDVTKIKRGDVLVFRPYGQSVGSAGHIGFAYTDYSGRNKSKNTLKILGQNQAGSTVVNIAEYPIAAIVGYFRNTRWTSVDPDEPVDPDDPEEKGKEGKDHFPWAVAWHHWSNFKR